MTRRAWILIVSGYVAMAVGFTVFAFLLAEHVRDLDQAKAGLRTRQQETARAVVHNAGAICLGLTAPTKTEEMALIDAFLKGDGTIVAQFTPLCARVAERAAKDVFNGHLPAELQAELNQVK